MRLIAIRAMATVALLGIAAMPVAAGATELLMMEQAGCAWCLRWNVEIGKAYPNTEEGRLAPLRRINIHEPMPEDLEGIVMERFTPTFVLVSDGVEVARMRGYAGDQFFWHLLGEMLDKLPERQKK